MITYVFNIEVESGFGTPLKGDTILGHICWQAANDDSLFGYPIGELLKDYHSSPFLVVSSAYPVYKDGCNGMVYALKRPDIPLSMLFDLSNKNITERKEQKNKRWMCVNSASRLDPLRGIEYVDDSALLQKINGKQKKTAASMVIEFAQQHNTINRLTGTTGEDMFAPYTVTQEAYYPRTKLSIFIGIDDGRLTFEQVKKALKRIGQFGYGKDASTGLGKFEVGDVSEVKLERFGSDSPNACYTLSPCVPQKKEFSEMFFTPFVRFGKHGDRLALSKHPFKNPVIMADEGAVLKVKDGNTDSVFDKPYIGTAVSGVSKLPETECQGYSLYIPISICKEEGEN